VYFRVFRGSQIEAILRAILERRSESMRAFIIFRFSDFDLLSAFGDSGFGFGPGSLLLE
jgi:hypothetical protein